MHLPAFSPRDHRHHHRNRYYHHHRHHHDHFKIIIITIIKKNHHNHKHGHVQRYLHNEDQAIQNTKRNIALCLYISRRPVIYIIHVDCRKNQLWIFCQNRKCVSEGQMTKSWDKSGFGPLLSGSGRFGD